MKNFFRNYLLCSESTLDVDGVVTQRKKKNSIIGGTQGSVLLRIYINDCLPIEELNEKIISYVDDSYYFQNWQIVRNQTSLELQK